VSIVSIVTSVTRASRQRAVPRVVASSAHDHDAS
jgi:hypothetical protein